MTRWRTSSGSAPAYSRWPSEKAERVITLVEKLEALPKVSELTALLAQ